MIVLNKPLISVITIVLNGKQFVEKTINSVLNQDYDNVEYIVIDGGSTDGTLDIIKQYKDKIDYFVSEPDRGIYDAMNKGIDVATGDWINFMNSSDCFFSNLILSDVFVNKQYQADILYGNHQVIYFHKTKLARTGNLKKLWQGPQFSHQSAFVRTNIHKANKFNITNKISSDFEFFYQAYNRELAFQYLAMSVANVSACGISDRQRVDSIVEHWKVVKKNNKVNFYYIRRILLEMLKHKIKTWLAIGCR